MKRLVDYYNKKVSGDAKYELYEVLDWTNNDLPR